MARATASKEAVVCTSCLSCMYVCRKVCREHFQCMWLLRTFPEPDFFVFSFRDVLALVGISGRAVTRWPLRRK